MSDDIDEQPYDRNRSRLRIAQDLSAIEDMFMRLADEAVHRAGDPSMPGGQAMVLLGPGADLEAFGYAQMSELMGRTDGVTEVALGGDIEPPLSFLASWCDVLRDHRGQEPSQRRATIGREVAYLRKSLDWMLGADDDGTLWFEPVIDFEDGLRKVRKAMEAVLRDGEQVDRGASCLQCDEPLVREWADGDGKTEWDDCWVCLTRDCPETSYTYAQYLKAMEGEYLNRAAWLTAQDMERHWRIPKGSLHGWASRDRVRKKRDIHTGRMVYNVADAVKCRDISEAA